jgi:hypothetical protein
MAEEKKDGDDLDIADTVGPAANYAIAKNFFNFFNTHTINIHTTSRMEFNTIFEQSYNYLDSLIVSIKNVLQ